MNKNFDFEVPRVRIEEILDEDGLYRRFHVFQLKDDGSISSAAFHNTSNTDDMSVDLSRLTSIEQIVLEYPNLGVASFVAELARRLNQQVLHDPIAANIAHSIVRGRKTRSTSKKLARGSTIVSCPPE